MPLSSLDKPQPVSLGLLVDFTSKTVKGLPFLHGGQLKITEVNELHVVFGASEKVVNNIYRSGGKLDRVTGDVEASSVVYSDHGSLSGDGAVHYSLKCQPTQRMF
jgi:hypothetical protein